MIKGLIAGIGRWLYAAVASVGLVGVSLISYGQFSGDSNCPQLGPLPICYVILACYAAVLISAFVAESKRAWLFWPGWIGVFVAAAFGSSMELAGQVTCPRSASGIPTCYFSLLMATAIVALYLWANRNVEKDLV